MKKKNINDDIAQKNLINLLKKGDLAALDQIKTEYLYLTQTLLKIFINEDEPLKIISDLAYQKLIDNKQQITSRQHILDIIFKETIIASSFYCNKEKMPHLEKEMTALKDIFLQIEKLPVRYRPLIRMTFRRERIKFIQNELNLNTLKLTIKREEATNILIAGLRNTNKNYAANLFIKVAYNLIFFAKIKVDYYLSNFDSDSITSYPYSKN